MDPQTFLDVATVVTKLKMYPYFDVAHYVLCCLAVRDDIVPQGELPAAEVLPDAVDIKSKKVGRKRNLDKRMLRTALEMWTWNYSLTQVN